MRLVYFRLLYDFFLIRILDSPHAVPVFLQCIEVCKGIKIDLSQLLAIGPHNRAIRLDAHLLIRHIDRTVFTYQLLPGPGDNGPVRHPGKSTIPGVIKTVFPGYLEEAFALDCQIKPAAGVLYSALGEVGLRVFHRSIVYAGCDSVLDCIVQDGLEIASVLLESRRADIGQVVAEHFQMVVNSHRP